MRKAIDSDGEPEAARGRKARRRLLLLCGVSPPVLLLAYLCMWPVPIDPVAWTAPPIPAASGDFAPNDRLQAVRRVALDGVGPEHIAVDANGSLYTGLEDGRILRLRPDGSGVETFADTGGRPLGMDFAPTGDLIVADAIKGLLSISPQGTVRVLAREHGGKAFAFPDGCDVSSDGTIYFTDATDAFSYREGFLDLIEHRPRGRLLSYDPQSKTTRLLLDGLYFANGVALSSDQRSLLVVETGMCRVTRYWLKGPKQGSSEVFIENLPGYPDGVSAGSGGVFWLTLISMRDPEMEAVLPQRPFLRKVLARLPLACLPGPGRHAYVLGLDSEGKVRFNLQDLSPDSFSPVSSVLEHKGTLYLGSYLYRGLGTLARPF